MLGIASAATSVVIGAVAAGGVLLSNHLPLVIAEQFGALAPLCPERIYLGLGRAPGTDGATLQAFSRHIDANDNFPQEVMELSIFW